VRSLNLAILLLVAACGDGSGGDTSAHDTCVEETNRYRSMAGRSALKHSDQLEQFADAGAMVDFGAQPHDHFRSTSGGGIAFAENECPHWDLQQEGGGDMDQLVKACIAAFVSEGPGGGHYENVMGNYGSLGCGIFESNASVTIIQDYGR
jgi:hypothetical protein